MVILAIDPGITSGFVKAGLYDEAPITLECGEGIFSHRELWEFLYDVTPDVLICESFEYRSRARDNLVLFSREMIGIVKLYAEYHPESRLIMQTAASGKSYFGDDKKLKDLGVYKVGKQHGRDAMRHFLHWLMFGQGFQYYQNQPLQLT